MHLLTYMLPLLAFLAGCGAGEQQPQSQETQAQTQEIRTIDIIGVDQMKYVVKEEGELIGTAGTIKTSGGDTYLQLQNIEATPGEKLRIRLTTVSDLPATAMAHNWVLLKLGIDPASFTKEAMKAKSNEYIPEGRTDDVIAHTGLAGGGETVEVTVTVPEKTGDYNYLCTFPGHFAAGMKGKLVVQ